MKHYRPLLLVLLAVLSGCKKDEDACTSGPVVHAFPEATEASWHFDADLQMRYIRYFVPGTIDSFYVGYLCTQSPSDLEFSEGRMISFTGNFREASDDLSPLSRIGGAEYFYLELTSLDDADDEL